MQKQDVDLPEAQTSFIREMLGAGRYKNASDVVCVALQLLEREENEHSARLERLRAEIQRGLNDIEAGNFVELISRADIDALGQEISRRGQERLAKEADAPSTPAK